ncbi:MAG: peptide ABC transporter substrate-binding protein [Chloroflexota bacterium]
MRKRLLVPVVVLLIVVLFGTVSCAMNQSPADTAVPATVSEQLPPLEISRQNSLILFDVGPTTLDPALARDTTSASYVKEIFSGLVMLNRDLEVVPDIARKWEISQDGKTYTFYLRKDAKFHNGEPVIAHDFKYSVERACDPETGSKSAANYLGDIIGVQEKLLGKAETVRGVTVKDDYTLQLSLKERNAIFLAKLTYPVACVVNQENVSSGEGWWRHPVGNGPFKLERWQRDRLLVLERNDLYYGEMPEIKHAIFSLWGGNPMIMYENGEIDLTYVSTANVERARDPANPLHDELVEVPEFSIWYVGFDTTKPPFDSVKVRQAFCHAIDKERIIELILKDTVRGTDLIVPPGIPDYDNRGINGLEFDPEKAQQLIQQSKYGSVSELPPITFTTSGRGTVSSINEALIYMWKENLGVEVEMWHLQPEVYPYVIKEEKGEIFDLGWVADYPSPQNFLEMLFRSGSEDNVGEYSNPEVDVLLDEAKKEGNRSARMGMYKEAERVILNDAACLPLFFGREYMLVKPYVKNFVAAPMPLPWLKYVSIERE